MRQSSLNHFIPDSQASTRFGVVPFQRYELNLDNVDRTEPETFPTIEGESLYCERADYPALFNMVLPGKGIQSSHVFRTGTKVIAPFKGLSISHPLLTPVGLGRSVISFIVGKSKNTEIDTSLGDSAMPMVAAFRYPTNTALQQQYKIFVPAGSRRIRKLAFIMPATTLTATICTFNDSFNNGVASFASIKQQIGPNIFTYNGANIAGTNLKVTASAVTGQFYFEAYDIAVPTCAAELFIQVDGTGLATVVGALECVFT